MVLLYRLDSSHTPIFDALVAAGRPSWSVAHIAGFGCDILTTHVKGWPVFMECKAPGTAPSLRKLTPSEARLQALFPEHYVVAQDAIEALRGVGIEAAKAV